MRKFRFLIICSVIILGLGVVHAAAQINIRDVRYSEGEDFVKVQFLSDAITSVPKLLPYDEDSMLVEMRFFNVNFETDQREFVFESRVIRKVEILQQDAGVYDARIYLKQNYTDYRISTNSQGVFVEFKKNSSLPVSPAPQESPPALKGGNNYIEDIDLYKKEEGMVGFKILLKNPGIEYREIPIYHAPSRLAIDFENTKSRAINRSINYSMVKGFRGALNRPSVYRVVFDLDYLKNYRVYQKGQAVFVDIYEKGQDVASQKIQDVPPADPVNNQETSDAPPPESKPETVQADPVKVDSEQVVAEGNTLQLETPDRGEFFQKPQAQSEPQEDPPRTETTSRAVDSTENLRKTIDRGKEYSGEPMDISLYDADLKDFITMIAKKTGLNITWDPGVEGRIRGVFHQVPWDQALELFLKQNGLAMQMEGNILRIADAQKLAQEAERNRELQKSREMQVELQVITRDLNYANADEVSKVITKYLSPRGQVQVDKRTNKLIIQETPNKIGIIDKLIDEIDTGIPQVTIEARIVETKLNYKKNLGIQWGYRAMMDARYGNQTSLQFPNSVAVDGYQLFNDKNPGLMSSMGGYAINLPAAERTSGTLFSFGNVANTFNLDLALTAMQQEGKGRVISAPKTTVLNNKESEIIQGQQIPIQTIVNQTVSVRFQQASLELKVTPQITPRGTIITDIEIHNDAPDFANLVNGIPPINTQQTTTTVEISDGDTLVIGGMYRVETDHASDQVPLLSKIPILGGLFKNSSRFRQQRELLIFITPRIIK